MGRALTLEEFMVSVGIEPSKPIVPSHQQFVRFHIEGDRCGTRNGWLIMDVVNQLAHFGSWRTGQQYTWAGHSHRLPSHEYKRLATSAARERSATAASRCIDGKMRAKALWDIGSPVLATHPYLQRKFITALGIKQRNGSLLVPVHDERGQLQSIQFINAAGEKRFLAGAPTKGGRLLLGSAPAPHHPVLLCEGYATGMTLHSTLGLPVIVAFTAGNLLDVGTDIRKTYRMAKLFICADNDHQTAGNPGLTKGRLAARRLNAQLIAPPRFHGGSDFNDLYCLLGSETLVEHFLDTPLSPFIQCQSVILSSDLGPAIPALNLNPTKDSCHE